jgi:tripartite-type tricarboxylate transporter receptor subunit TctC
MWTTRRSRPALAALLGAGAALSAAAGIDSAQGQPTFPTREIRAVVPFPPGGAIDAAVRILQPQLSSHLGVPVVVVNRPGAGGVIGTGAALSADPDGYTVAATPSTTITVARLTQKNVPYTVDDLVPLGTYAVDVGAIVVHADSPWKTYEDLVAHAAGNPGKLSYASPGVGSVSAFVVEAIKLHHGLKMVEVPFQGSPPANSALLGRQVDFATVAFSNAAPFLDAKRLRALVVSAETRLRSHPDIPTLEEKKVPHASLGLTLGLYVPKRTPPPVVDRLADALRVAMANPAVVAALEKAGLFVRYSDRQAAQRQLMAEQQSVSELGRKLKLSPAQ